METSNASQATPEPTLTPTLDDVPAPALDAQPLSPEPAQANGGALDDSMLTDDEKQMVASFANQIDVRDFKRGANKIESLRTRYDKAEANVNKIVEALKGHQMTLMKDAAMLDQMYELNLTYFKELTMYLLAGRKKLAQVREGELAELVEHARATGRAEDAQAAQDL